ncbi:Golgi-associated kinase 1B [Silurus meridionalis]|uniref:Golgi-associated kinase 1B n=1 Tax=Silurus meridionalis TaxID=175797 RepID=UPI001EEA75C5|nr:Golgi-associated kinase 1B [Silurus meridionalis]XP_046705312.1 Golgi-associated kinase 1B [Silurus meridionalis]KAI5104780.1 protein FAM198B [Silurus meridionalis]
MEKHLSRPGRSAHTILHLTCLSFWRLLRACWRFSRSRTAFLLTFACLIYLFCLELWISRIDHDQNLTKGRRLILERIPVSPSPTHSNVVYITLKSKRQKPAILRATLHPKTRRKKVRNLKNLSRDTVHHYGEETLMHAKSREAWRQLLYSFKPGKFNVFDNGNDDDRSSIRIYSQKAPPWFSQADIETMRFLSKCKIGRVKILEPENAPPVLLFKRTRGFNQSSDLAGECEGQCGVIKRPEDMSEVFAFHLDRVLGLNRSLVTISRRFQALDGQLCPVTLYDPSVVPVPESRSGSLSWSWYQESLRYLCWQRGVPKPKQSCSSLHHQEWSKVTLFDFLLQNHQRLDRNCCGFRPRPQDSCVQFGYHTQCSNVDSLQISHIVHRKSAPRRMVYINNNAFFDRDEENLDFRLLEGIKELPDVAVSVLRSQRLRQNLLQSLFMDEQFWENQGGRRGIDKLIDVIERRARVLLRYINAHGIELTAMKP